MAHASVKSHANAAKNPKAHLKNAITEDDAIKAPMVAESLGLYDCCGVSDGSACAIVTTPEIARSLGKKDLVGFYDASGKIPCQIDGGLQCFGHPIGASGRRMLYEMYPQLTGRAGTRQLGDPVLGDDAQPRRLPEPERLVGDDRGASGGVAVAPRVAHLLTDQIRDVDPRCRRGERDDDAIGRHTLDRTVQTSARPDIRRPGVAIDLQHPVDEVHDPVVRDTTAGVGRGFPAAVEADAAVRNLDDQRGAPRRPAEVIVGHRLDDRDVGLGP